MGSWEVVIYCIPLLCIIVVQSVVRMDQHMRVLNDYGLYYHGNYKK